MREHTIWLEPAAPPKPGPGQACNGCGVCCAAGPCPLGAIASRRLRGPCALLRWQPEAGRYRCGALDAAPAALRPWVQRWIAAGQGCDSTLVARHPGQTP
jgi:hypothetical protein